MVFFNVYFARAVDIGYNFPLGRVSSYHFFQTPIDLASLNKINRSKMKCEDKFVLVKRQGSLKVWIASKI